MEAAAPNAAASDDVGLRPHGYEKGEFIGRGYTGRVYKGRYVGAEPRGDLQPGQLVALKFVKREGLYPHEILLQSQMQHMNIVRVFDVFPCAPRLSNAGRAACGHYATS